MKRPLWKWQYALPEELRNIKPGQMITVKSGHPLAGMTLKITRVDNHVYPICAGYTRFKLEQVILKGEYYESSTRT